MFYCAMFIANLDSYGTKKGTKETCPNNMSQNNMSLTQITCSTEPYRVLLTSAYSHIRGVLQFQLALQANSAMITINARL